MLSFSNPKTWTRGQRNTQKLEGKFSLLVTKKTYNRWLLVGNLFWATIYLAGITLTVLTCIDLYQRYRSTQYLSVNVATVHNKTATLPDPTICLPYFHANELIQHRWKKDLMTAKTIDDLDRTEEDDSAFYFNELDEFFNNYTSWQEVKEAQYWPITILHIAQMYLSKIYETESLTGYSENPMKNAYDNSDNTSQAIDEILIPKMKEWNTSLGEFRDAFAHQFGQFFKIFASYIYYPNGEFSLYNMEKKEISINSSEQELVFVNQYQVCYKLKIIESVFNSSSSLRIVIPHWKQTYALEDYIQHDCTNSCQVHSAGSEPVTVDIAGKSKAGVITHQTDSTYFARFGEFTELNVNPTFQYASLDNMKGEKQCSKDENEEVCRAKCRSKSVERLCNCSATSLVQLLADSSARSSMDSTCSFDRYELCLQNFSGSEDADCMSQCLSLCTRWMFNVEKRIYEPIQMGYNRRRWNRFIAIVDIKVATYDYLIFNEFIDWSFYKVTSFIGGALAFWLGIDIFTILYYTLLTLILLVMNRFLFKKIGTARNGERSTGKSNLKGKVERAWQWIFQNLGRYRKDDSNSLHFTMHERIERIIKNVVWIVLFIIGLALIIMDLVPLYQDYTKNNSTTYSLNVAFNETINIPDVAVCIPASVTGNELHPGGFNIQYIRSDINSYFRRANMTRELFLSEEHSWSLSVIYVASLYLQAVQQITQATYDVMIQNWKAYSGSDQFTPWIEFRSFLVNLSVSDLELKQKFNSEYWKQSRIEAECIRASLTDSNRYIPLIPTISMETALNEYLYYSPISVCYHFPLQQFDYQSPYDSCSIRFLAPQKSPPSYLTFKSSDTYAYSKDWELSAHDSVRLTFKYSIIYQSLETADCSTETSPLICVNNCRNEYIERYCANCTIKSSSDIQNTDETWRRGCSWTEYEACLKLAAPFVRNCASECRKFPPCTRKEYKINPAAGDILYEKSSYTMVNISIQDFTYPLMTERSIWSPEEFIAAVGGILGFWLGVDVAFLIQIVLATVAFLICLCFRRDYGTVGNVNASRHILLGQLASKFGIDYKGLSQMMIVKALIGRILWIIICILFGIFTLKQCWDYSQQYYNNLDSRFETVRNRTITIPTSTICVPYVYLMFERPTPHHMPSPDEVNKQSINEQNATKSMILSTDVRWSDDLLRIAWLYLVLVEGFKVVEFTSWSYTWEVYMYYWEDEIAAFSEKMTELNISNDELMQKFGQEMRRRYWVDVLKYVKINGSLMEVMLNIERTTFVAETKICYALPRDAVSFTSTYEYVKLKVNKTPFSNSSCTILSMTARKITIDLLGRDTGTDSDDFMLEQPFGISTSTSISIEREIRVMEEVHGKRRCSRDTTTTACRKDCLVSAVERQCNCTPNECRFRQLKNCTSNFDTFDAFNCIHSCLTSCERVSYWLNAKDWGGWNFDSCEAEYRIGVSQFNYPLFIESYDVSFWEFIVSFGGLLSIWLPLDVIFIIDSFIGVVKRLCFRRKAPQRTTQKESEF